MTLTSPCTARGRADIAQSPSRPGKPTEPRLPPPARATYRRSWDPQTVLELPPCCRWTPYDRASAAQRHRPRRRRGIALLSSATAAAVLLLAVTIVIATWVLLRQLSQNELDSGRGVGDGAYLPSAAFCQRVSHLSGCAEGDPSRTALHLQDSKAPSQPVLSAHLCNSRQA